MIANQTIPRRGTQRADAIPPTVLEQLNHGEIESQSALEAQAIDFAVLMRSAVPRISCEATASMHRARCLSITERMALAGKLLLHYIGTVAYLQLARHRSDTVRGWAAHLLAIAPQFSLGERLKLIRPLANDRNPRVREWARVALRPQIAANLATAIDLLEEWTISGSPFLRRFASEATRPRGEWCPRIARLVARPDLGLPLLEALRSDPHHYVQDSVADWLSDAAIDKPDWVRNVCARWQRESRSEATSRICRRAMQDLPR
jgi:3-methyladenine DNA glycosylase AlkC